MDETKISKVIAAGCDAAYDDGEEALRLFAEACSAMTDYYNSAGETAFLKANASRRWARRIVDNLCRTIDDTPQSITFSGAYKHDAIKKQLAIYERLLILCAGTPNIIAKIRYELALLLRDPDDLTPFDDHFRMAVSARPRWSEAYMCWAEEFESSGSPKERRHAIEIYEQALRQRSLEGGKDARIKILEKLIHRCQKERKHAEAEKYTAQLRKLRPIVPVAPDLRIRRSALCPCHSGKKYKDCCGKRESS